MLEMWKTYPHFVDKWTYPGDISLFCEKIYRLHHAITKEMSTKKTFYCDGESVENLSTFFVDKLCIMLIYVGTVENVENLSTKNVDNSLMSRGYPPQMHFSVDNFL
jgi:hypothetical protein